MGLRVFNTLGRRLEEFAPGSPPKVGMYVCGPTVYGHSHLGHAKSYVSFDIVLRWLRLSGFNVNYIQNITDVGHMTENDEDAGEDKIIAEARRRGLHPMAIAEQFTYSYFEDMDALNVLRPDISPRASGHIPEQIEGARKLLASGNAYEAGGSVYFDVSSFPRYGRLSGRSVEELEAGARVAVNDEKRHPADFALWKRAEPGHIMHWPSPWGEGFPGWHLECSVMSQKYIGETLDIHGGGLENQFPHHECEIAQAECITGKPFCRYWLHNNMVTLNGQKMGKSLGNSILLKQIFRDGHALLEKTFEPAVIRHFILTSHYRSPLDFSNEALRAAETGSHRLRDVARKLHKAGLAAPAGPATIEFQAAVGNFEQRFADAMNEDFNTGAALAVVFELARSAERWIEDRVPRDNLLAADAVMQRLTGDALGLKWQDAAGGAAAETERNALVQILVDLRAEARKSKNYALGDQVRQRLTALGIELKDGPGGTTW